MMTSDLLLVWDIQEMNTNSAQHRLLFLYITHSILYVCHFLYCTISLLLIITKYFMQLWKAMAIYYDEPSPIIHYRDSV